MNGFHGGLWCAADAIDKLAARLQAAEEQLFELAELPGHAHVITPSRLPEAPGDPPGSWQRIFPRQPAADGGWRGAAGPAASTASTRDAGKAGGASAEEHALRHDANVSRATAELYHVVKQAQQPNYAADLQALPESP